MTKRTRILGLCFAALLCATVSCVWTEPGELVHRDGPIPGITPDKDGPDEVVKALGKPSSKANGWWKDEHQFDMEYRVWYYKGVGRVIFRPGGRIVAATEADKSQLGTP